MDRVLQFGTGRFLRGFVEAFIDASSESSDIAERPLLRRVTVVETSGSGMAERLAAQDHVYQLHIRGLERGSIVDTSRTIRVIDRSVDASRRLDDVTGAALDSEVTTIVSNTTEQGYAVGRFPRILASVLAARAHARLPGVVILPCELIDRNGDRLRQLVSDELVLADEQPSIVEQVLEANAWAITMVDRIVTAAARTTEEGRGLDVVAEPYSSWVIEVAGNAPLIEHPRVMRAGDVTPFSLRKIRILNGAHSALVSRTRGGEMVLVREAMADADIGEWLEGLLREEIVPALNDRIMDGQEFATSVLERLRNPFLDHRLSDIESNHQQKLGLRLLPSYHDYIQRFGRAPQRLSRILGDEGLLG